MNTNSTARTDRVEHAVSIASVTTDHPVECSYEAKFGTPRKANDLARLLPCIPRESRFELRLGQNVLSFVTIKRRRLNESERMTSRKDLFVMHQNASLSDSDLNVRGASAPPFSAMIDHTRRRAPPSLPISHSRASKQSQTTTTCSNKTGSQEHRGCEVCLNAPSDC